MRCWDCGREVAPNEDGKVPMGIFGVTCWLCMGNAEPHRKLSEPLADILNNGGVRGGGGPVVLAG